MKFTNGTVVTWHSSAGHLIGTIKEIQLAESAAKVLTPWLIIHHIKSLDSPEPQSSSVMLCGSNQALTMMRVEVV
jgi:hypothetical protein